MKKLHSCFTLLVFFFLAKNAVGQSDLAIGQWKSHLPFSSGLYITQSDDKVFYATRYAVLEVDKQERSIRRMTKVEGLSQVGVSLVKYNRGSNILLVVYDNSVVDLVSEDGILTLPAIQDAPFIGGKTIFDVYMANDSIAYLAASYGITTLNLKQGIFPNTIKAPVGVEVHSVRLLDGKIYAATSDGLYAADPNAGYNINDFANWEWLNGTRGFPADFNSDAMTGFNGQLYLDVNDSLYAFDGEAAAYVFHSDTFDLRFITAEGEHLLAGFFCGPGCKGRVFSLDENHLATPAGSDCVLLPRYAIEDGEGNIWYADEARDFRTQEAGSSACTSFSVNSPRSINTYQLDVADGNVWVAAGGVDLTFSALSRTDGFFSLTDGQWEAYNLIITPELSGISDFLDIKVHPTNGKVYAAAYLDALVSYDPATEAFEVFNETNSTLQGAQGDTQRTRVTGLAFDADYNLWVCNHLAPKPLAVMTEAGEWFSFELPCVADTHRERVMS